MDYERAYKEAESWMRDLYPTLTGSMKEDAEHFFPGLKESEDERIRKILVGMVNNQTGEWKDKDKILAYLEKQKGRGSIEYVIKNITKNKEAATEFLRSAGIMNDNGELAEMYRSEQKPAEWSDEDDYRIRWIIQLLTTMREKGVDDRFGDSVFEDIPDMIAWLKSLRPQPHWKPSKEQMAALKDALESRRNIHNASVSGDFDFTHLNLLYSDLKKLM